MAGSATTWKAVMPKLAKHFTVLAPDLIGHGRSDKPMTDYSLGNYAAGMRDFLVALGIDRATVVGQSLGGGVAMQMAYQHPERVERLVLVASGGLGREVSVILRLLTIPGGEYVMPLIFNRFARDVGNRVSLLLRRAGLRAPEVEEGWRAFVSLTEPQNRVAFVRTLRAVIDLGGQSVSAHDRLYLAAHMPTLIVWGTRDPIIPIEHGHAAHAAMPGSRFEVFEGSGHFPHCEEPDHFADVMVDFVAETPSSMVDPDDWRELLAHPNL
ncbi:MAG: alpha/beta fold hydrolase [Actinobacteria bacterium]|nr:alpha/beta fold hydrolase [Actinomycetota bacterium]